MYEPFDFFGWVPDFVIHLDDDFPTVLVEVKPAYLVDEALRNRISENAPRSHVLIATEQQSPFGKNKMLLKFPEGTFEDAPHQWMAYAGPVIQKFAELFSIASNTVQWKKPSLLCLHCGKEPYSL
jgi:hypothetical protein